MSSHRMENLRVCFVENGVRWYEREEYGCFDYMSCVLRRFPGCRQKTLTTDPEVAAYVQGLRKTFSGVSGREPCGTSVSVRDGDPAARTFSSVGRASL